MPNHISGAWTTDTGNQDRNAGHFGRKVMPLTPGTSQAVIGKNIGEFHGGKTYAHTKAKFGAKKANAQAVAVAMNMARKSGRSIPPGRNAKAAHRFDYLLPQAPANRKSPKRPIRSGSPKMEERGEKGKDRERGEKKSRGRLPSMLSDAMHRRGMKEARLHNSMMGL